MPKLMTVAIGVLGFTCHECGEPLQAVTGGTYECWSCRAKSLIEIEGGRYNLMIAVKPVCEHGAGLTEYCEPCGRINSA